MANERKLPAYPIFTKDPNFSLWSTTDILNESNLQSWFGETKRVYGLVRIDGETYCFLGDCNDLLAYNVKKAKQTAVDITAFTTDYRFQVGEATLAIRFVSPLPLNDLSLLSMPVCYMQYEITGTKTAELAVFVNRAIAYNNHSYTTDKTVKGGVMPFERYETAFMGLNRQLPLSNSHDMLGADWGWWYLSGEKAYMLDETAFKGYVRTGDIAFSLLGEERYIASINHGNKGLVMLGFDEGVSIDYFGEYLKGAYLKTHTVTDGLAYVFANFERINEKLAALDADLVYRTKRYGKEYLYILYASLRQSIAGHKMVYDNDGNLLFLSKECGSNGCIATVDISYPSMPLFLLYEPKLVKAMMLPILKFAKMPVWKYDFSPHDAGTYPHCTGQFYALKKDGERFHGDYVTYDLVKTNFPIYLLPPTFEPFDDRYQMPVEECSNMLIMFLACARYAHDKAFFWENAELCKKWADYLVKYGLKPDEQLCTDDFAGHLKNNINLSIKAVVGIASYAELAQDKAYRKVAEAYAGEITAFISQYAHAPLTWDLGEETYSLKYNFVFDKIFGLGLFDKTLLEKEVDYYLTKSNRYGVPLDSRKGYTKSDWLVWSAKLTDDLEKQKELIAPIYRYLCETLNRVPFSDFYETKDGGKPDNFRARSVQAGCFILLL
ncbi:MAG: DUF4965 domain-containing protein [Clostridia bacterium]|nr:DUF4965 domain-containing protein [Clostridia bacterium]